VLHLAENTPRWTVNHAGDLVVAHRFSRSTTNLPIERKRYEDHRAGRDRLRDAFTDEAPFAEDADRPAPRQSLWDS